MGNTGKRILLGQGGGIRSWRFWVQSSQISKNARIGIRVGIRIFSKFSLFCRMLIFHPLNQDDDLKESESESEVKES